MNMMCGERGYDKVYNTKCAEWGCWCYRQSGSRCGRSEVEQVTRKQLESYRSMKQEISEIQYALTHLGEGDSVLGSSVINDYRRGYPVPQAVVGVDWERLEWQKKHYEKRIYVLQEQCDAIERYVEEDIEDSLTRRIFRMYFLEGRTQKEIAGLIHMDRSSVSRKLNAPAR